MGERCYFLITLTLLRNEIRTSDRVKSPSASKSAEIDAILEDDIHIQASGGNLLNPQRWKIHYEKHIAVSKRKTLTDKVSLSRLAKDS